MSEVRPLARHQLRGELISWVGREPGLKGIWAGTDSGRFGVIGTSPKTGKPILNQLLQAGDDAVNGAAFLGDFGVATTRAEVHYFNRKKLRNSGNRIGLIRRPHGAHGVVTLNTPGLTSAFLLAVGNEGMLLARPSDKKVSLRHFHVENRFYFYKLAAAGRYEGNHLVVAACRDDGLATVLISPDVAKGVAQVRRFAGVDFVDVCPLRDPRMPRSVVAVSRSGAIYFIPDVLQPAKVNIIQLDDAENAVYGMVMQAEHGFVLTDTHLVCLPGLRDHFIQPQGPHQAYYAVPVDASDIYTTGRSRLALLEQDAAVEFDSIAFAKSVDPEHAHEGGAGEADDSWDESGNVALVGEDSEAFAFA